MQRLITVAVALLLTVLNPTVAKADETIRVGLIQMDGRLNDKQYNLARAEKLIRQAAARGVKIVCTPEASVQGYVRVELPPGTSADAPQIVAKRAKILAAAETIPGPPQTALAPWRRNWASGWSLAWTRIGEEDCSTPQFS